MFSVPILISLIAFVFFGVQYAIQLFKGTSTRSQTKELKNLFITSTLVGIYQMHSNIIATLLGTLNCMWIIDRLYMKDHLDIECWEGAHLFVALPISLSGILLWILISSLLLLFYVHRNR